MKTAQQIFDSTTRDGMDEYFAALDVWGASGKLAAYLLLAQRATDRLDKARINPPSHAQWLRYKRAQTHYALTRLVEFCQSTRPGVPFTLKSFKYGIRIKLRGQPSIRFRKVGEDDWTGDRENLPVIIELCEGMVAHGRTDDRLRTLLKWPTAV
jgi:hypothetical protein